MSTPEEEARTVYEAKADVRYAVMMQECQERLFRRLALCLNVFTLMGTLAAAAGLTESLRTAPGRWAPWMITLAAFVVLLTGVASSLTDFSGRATKHCLQRERYLDLLGRAEGMTVAKIDRESAEICKQDPPDIASLEMPTWNRLQRSLGYESRVRRLRIIERLMQWLA